MNFFDAVCLLAAVLIVGLFIFAWITLKLTEPARLKAKKDVPGLIKQLNVAAVPRAKAAAEALGEVGDARAVMPLTDMLTSKETNLRMAAANSLGQIGDARAVPPLAGLVSHPDPALRNTGEASLLHLAQQIESNPPPPTETQAAAIQALLPLLRSPNRAIAGSAAAGLATCAWQPSGEKAAWFYAVREDWEACVRLGAEAVEALEFWLAHWRISSRESEAVQTIARIGGPRAADFFARQLTTRTPEAPAEKLIQAAVRQALPEYCPALVEPLLRHFDEPARAQSGPPLDVLVPLVRIELAHPGRVLPAVQELAQSRQPYYQRAAAAFTPALQAPLLARLRSPEAEVRRQALDELALGNAFPFSTYEAAVFCNLLSDPDYTVFTWREAGESMHGGDGRETQEHEYSKVDYPLRVLTRTVLQKEMPLLDPHLRKFMEEAVVRADYQSIR